MATPGNPWSWGYNQYGQLGNGKQETGYFPKPISTIHSKVIGLDGGLCHSLALFPAGSVYAWGNNSRGQLGTGGAQGNILNPVLVSGLDSVTAIACGVGHSLALVSDGRVYTWGDYLADELLRNDRSTYSNVPVLVPKLNLVTAIAAGAVHSLALLPGGAVLAWGYNCSGQLGDGTPNNSEVPVSVVNLNNVNITAVACGLLHSMARSSDGSVYAWGSNDVGQLGFDPAIYGGSHKPLKIASLKDITAIAAGYHFSMALSSAGNVYAWGQTGLLDNEGHNHNSHIPLRANLPERATAIACGVRHCLALLSNGNVCAWGMNDYGQLGVGGPGTICSQCPLPVFGLYSVSAISAGSIHSLAIVNSSPGNS